MECTRRPRQRPALTSIRPPFFLFLEGGVKYLIGWQVELLALVWQYIWSGLTTFALDKGKGKLFVSFSFQFCQ